MMKHRKYAVAYGKWLQSFLKAHRIKTSVLARESDYHHNVIRSWLRGRCLPHGFTLVVVATTLSEMTGRTRKDLLEEMASAILMEKK
jgi:hypothetical protein